MKVTELLKRDHQAVTKLFQRVSSGGRGRETTARKICDELDVHAAIEEEIFCPAVRESGDQELERQIDEAVQEHQQMKQGVQALRQRLEAGDGGEGADIDADVSALEQNVEHHVEEEEGEMFPRVEETMDESQLADLGRRVDARKKELMSQMTQDKSGASGGASQRGRAARKPAAQSRGGRGRGGQSRSTGSRSRTSGGRASEGRGRGANAESKSGSRAKSGGSRSTGSRSRARSRSTGRSTGGKRATGRKSATGRKAKSASSGRKRARGGGGRGR